MYNRVELKRDARKTFKTIRKLVGNRQCRKDLKMVTICVCYLTLLFVLVFSSCDIVALLPFSALTLLVGWQEGHLACKKN